MDNTITALILVARENALILTDIDIESNLASAF